MAKGIAVTAVQKVNARDLKRTQDKDDLDTLEKNACQPVSKHDDRLIFLY